MARTVAMTKKVLRRPSVSLKEPARTKVNKPTKPLAWKKKGMMGPCDVLSGRDKSSRAWPGNVALRQLVATYYKVHGRTTKRQEQHDMAVAVVQRIYDKGGSFYEKSKGFVMELPKSRALLKVQQVFRDSSNLGNPKSACFDGGIDLF